MATESAVFIEPLVGHEYQKLTYRLAWARKQYEINKSQVQDREYAGHSYDDWTILRESISAFKARMLSEHVLKLGPELNRLLISEAGPGGKRLLRRLHRQPDKISTVLHDGSNRPVVQLA